MFGTGRNVAGFVLSGCTLYSAVRPHGIVILTGYAQSGLSACVTVSAETVAKGTMGNASVAMGGLGVADMLWWIGQGVGVNEVRCNNDFDGDAKMSLEDDTMLSDSRGKARGVTVDFTDAAFNARAFFTAGCLIARALSFL